MTKSDFRISGLDGELQVGTNDQIQFSVVPDGVSRMRMRNAIKGVGDGNPTKVQWLFGEIDGVRCYVSQGEKITIVLTRQDLYP